ncbi:MAG TPA: tetratricopeptide repeat protein, partial [Candidatus Nitrosocosmicus sp.]|nr:tetratricopeptide repeat protein [Candidatus Nitrosocosmicus sp.]
KKDFEEQKADYYSVKIKNFLPDGKILYHQNVRLFKKLPQLRYEGKLHENINVFEYRDTLKAGESGILLGHMGYLPAVVSEKNKVERNYKIMEREVKNNPTGYNLYNMGTLYFQNDEYEKALETFTKAYELSKDKTYVKHLISNIAKCLRKMKRSKEAAGILLEAVAIHSNYTDFYMELAQAYQECGYIRDAEYYYYKCLELGDINDSVTTEGVGSYLAWFSLAKLYESQGRHADAFDAAFKSIEQKKSFRPALAVYLKSMLRTGIPLEETYRHICSIYRPSILEDLSTLIFTLYECRHPLLNRFFTEMKGEARADIKAVALQYDRNYDEALAEWNSMEVIPSDNGNDILLLALMTGDSELLNRIKSHFNISSKEWKTMGRFVRKETFDSKEVTEWIEERLLQLAVHLIILEEADAFEYLSAVLLTCSQKAQYELANILDNYGFSDLAAGVLENNLGYVEGELNSMRRLGDVFFRKGLFEEALGFYTELMKIDSEYVTYERLYDTYEKLGDNSKCNVLKQEIRRLFPLSGWVRR